MSLAKSPESVGLIVSRALSTSPVVPSIEIQSPAP
jgi:hypothetical protein